MNDFEPVTWMDEADGKLGRSNCLAVMLDDDTARKELLIQEKSFEGAWEHG